MRIGHLIAIAIGLVSALPLVADAMPGLAVVAPAGAGAVKLRSLAAGTGQNACPTGNPGILNLVGVPITQSVQLYVVSDPAPQGGYTWNVYSDNPAIAAAGDPTQGFIPQLYTPAGQMYSNAFTLYGVSVGQSNLIIQEVAPGGGSSSTPVTAWGVNPLHATDFLDANAPGNSCRQPGSPDMAQDAATLSTCGTTVSGTVADGVSQLLLRSVSGLAGTACYSITSSSALDQGSIAAGVVSTQPAGNLYYGTTLYQAPATYGDSSSNRQVTVQFSFLPSQGNSNTTTISSTLTVVRPPVVLIHGLWSDPGTWANAVWDRNPNSSYFLDRADYKSTNASHFSVNYPLVQGFVADGLQLARDAGYAATQVDVVGHSMGGLLTRLYAGSPAFQQPENFNKGDVRRLVTLDTPHDGSNLANLIVSMSANSAVFRAIGYLLPGVRNAFGGTPVFNQGAVCDLAENSPALTALAGGTNLPAQVISATGGAPGAPSGGAYMTPLEVMLDAPCTSLFCSYIPYLFPQDVANGYRFRQANDQIVSLSSETGGLGGINFANYVHTSVTGGSDVAATTYALLDGPAGGFASSLPGVTSNGLGNPLTVPGVGVARDQSDYAAECGSAGPLNPAAARGARRYAMAARRPAASAPALGAAAPAPDARVQISSPATGQTYTPGSTVNVTVQVAAGVTISSGYVSTNIPGVGAVNASSYGTTSFQASFVIPAAYTGAVTLTPLVIDGSISPIVGLSTDIAVVAGRAPTSLTLVRGSYVHVRSVPAVSSIYVTGNFPNNVHTDLSASATGTTYTSSNANVVTVDAEGQVQAVAYGSAAITVQNSGVKAYVTYVVENPAAPLPPQSDSAVLRVAVGGLQLNRTTGFYVQTVTVTNAQAYPVAGPLYLVAGGLAPGVILVNPGRGATQTIAPLNQPYVKLHLADGYTLAPGASVQVQLQFLNPSRARIAYTPQVYRTAGTP
ncbi:MAG: alpha/beta fold hydrolase [Burkholderiales bacterium]|nr:alpha/beta fold hydrolase [Burkholderiales bacterium]